MIQGALFPESSEKPTPARIARIAVELPVEGSFEYRIPERLAHGVKPGVRVWVSFSGRKVMGICLGLSDTCSVRNPLDVLGVVDATSLISEKLLDLVLWMASYYHCPIGEAFSTALPRAARVGREQRKILAARLRITNPEATALAEELLSKKPKQARILRLLAESDGMMSVNDLCSKANLSRSPVQTLARQGMVELFQLEVAEPSFPEETEAFPKPERLSQEQEEALGRILRSIERGEVAHFLLYGVTGSGKTEVYLRAIEEITARGKGAIVLVPEISLTPQTILRFRGRFKRVAVLHSRLSDKERFIQWKEIRQGKADVVVGARSAVFAPMPHLGLLVVDEEHETSFKQQNTPYYHTREVALKRGELEGAMVILGSATPSLEAFHQVWTGRTKPLVLRHRVGGRRFPNVSIINMKHEKMGRGSFISEPLKAALAHTLFQKKQTILFLNRRGYYTVLLCASCGEAVRCPQCDISLTLHRKANRMICHYCGHEALPQNQCPTCESSKLRYIGVGTERVEHEVHAYFPDAAVVRMDSDTMVGRRAHEMALNRFKSGEVDILIGTQMIAKGLDFPNVTLVGVISADTPLYQPDFRSSERAFQLLSQVAGRAGRGKEGGRVIVQTYNPGHYSVRYAVNNDYKSFAKKELLYRKEAGYPPFVRLLRALFTGEDFLKVQRVAESAREALGKLKLLEGTKLLGPAKAPISMISGRYRWHLLAKSMEQNDLDTIASELRAFFRKKGRTSSRTNRMTLDLDPLSML